MDVAVHQARFADALGAENDDFGFECVGHCGCGEARCEVRSGVVGGVMVVVRVLGAHFSVVGWRGGAAL